MRKIYFVSILLILAAGCTKPDPAAEKSAVEGAVRGFYDSFSKLQFDNMTTWLAPDFAGFENGMPTTGEGFVAMVKSMGVTSAQFDMDFVRTDVSGDLGHCIIHFKGDIVAPTAEMHLQTYENYILKKINGKWLISAYHSTWLNGPKKLEPGAILGLHTIGKSDLNPGVTLEQADEFLIKRFIPFYNQEMDELRIIPLHPTRGADSEKLGFIIYVPSDSTYKSIWNADGKTTPKGDALVGKLTPMLDEWNKFFAKDKGEYTDWQVR